MKKNLLKTMLAVAAICFGGMNVQAQEAQTDTVNVMVKMTFVDQSHPDSINGELETITVGYNKAPVVGGSVGFGQTSWNVNNIGYLQVDASAVPGIVTKATLKAKISGSTDSKRTTGWGVALCDSVWSNQLTYNMVKDWKVSMLLNGGNLVWTSTKASTVFEDHEWDITEALQGADFKGLATLVVYETAAAGGYMTDAEVELVYEPFEATTTKFDFVDGNKVFTDDSRITGAIEADATLNSNVLGWTCAGNAQNVYSFSHFDFTDLLNKPALVKVEFDYYNTQGGRSILTIGDRLVRGNTGNSGKATYSNSGAIFRIGSDKNNAFINNITLSQADKTFTEEMITDEGDTITISGVQPGLCNKWLHVTVIVNNDAKMVTWGVTLQPEEGEDTDVLIHMGSAPFYAADANECTQIDLFGYINNSHCAMIDNLEITNYKSNAVFADYTIQYVDGEGNELKASRTANGQVGKPITLLDSDKESIYTDEGARKYIYESDNSADVVITAEGTVVKVVFRQAKVYYAVLNCKAGSETLKQYRDLNKYWFFEGDKLTLYPSRGYKSRDGGYWFTDANAGYNCASYDFPGALTPVSQGGNTYYIGTLTYNKVDSVAYYADIEDLALPTVDAGHGTGLGQLEGTVFSNANGEVGWWNFSGVGSYFGRFSGGRGIRLAEGSYLWTEPIAEAATYKIRIYGRTDISAAQKPAIGLRDANGEVKLFSEIVVPELGSATTGEIVIEGVAIPAGSSFVIMNDGNASISFDDISMTKTGEYVDPTLVAVGIAAIEEQAVENGVTYNLAGQAVKVAKKGLYIRDGKKFIVK